MSSVNLIGLMLCPLAGGMILWVTPSRPRMAQCVGLCTSLITFLYSLLFLVWFDHSTAHFQFVQSIRWLPDSHVDVSLGIDGISLFFVVLTTFLIPTCLLLGWSVTSSRKEYMIALLIGESLMIAVFCMLDLLLFYVFYESVLIPMFLIIGIWGSRQRKVRAAYQFFLYTLLGSVFMLLAILLIFSRSGTTDVPILLTTEWGDRRQILLWTSFFASFSGKVPMVPVHLWLPEAHVEAPTAGSIILAGILLKLGTYGLLRLNIPMCPVATLYFTPFVYGLSVIAIVYTSLTTIRQIDLKRTIAYSSVAHMNLGTIGMFSLNIQGIDGSLLLMLSHGLVSSALFLCVGALYDRHKTRLVTYYGGLACFMPILSTVFLFFTLANMSLPGTSSFIGEFLIFVGAFVTNGLVACVASVGMVLGAAYALWLYTRVFFGEVKTHSLHAFTDLTRREAFMALPLVAGVIGMGVYPEVILDCMHPSTRRTMASGFDLSGLFPEIFIIETTLMLLIYGVVSSTSPRANPPLVRTVGGLGLLSVLLTLALVAVGSTVTVNCFHHFLIKDGLTSGCQCILLITTAGIMAMSGRAGMGMMPAVETNILILLSTGGLLLIISAHDLLVMFLAMELYGLCFYVIASSRSPACESSTEAGLKFFILGAFSSGLFLFGCSMVYGSTGATNLEELAVLCSGPAAGCGASSSSDAVTMGILFIGVGYLFKITAVPFHMWAPDVYEGTPTMATAFLSTAPKIAFLANMLRVFIYCFHDQHWQPLLFFGSIASMALGSFAALARNGAKRFLAYSSIGHVGYLCVGLSCGTTEGLQSLLIALLVYAFTTLNVFAIVLSLRRNRCQYLGDLAGMARTNPILALTLSLAMFSLAGIPPLAGFFSKYYLFSAGIGCGADSLAVMGVATSVISCLFYIRLVRVLCFDTSPLKAILRTPDREITIVLAATLVCLTLFFLFPPQLTVTHRMALGLCS